MSVSDNCAVARDSEPIYMIGQQSVSCGNEFQDEVYSVNEASSCNFVDITNGADENCDGAYENCTSGEDSRHMAGLFEDAIAKNKHLQAYMHSKMLRLDAKIKDLERLGESVHKEKRVVLKPEACMQLVSLPRIRSNARNYEDDGVPAMLKGPPENVHVAGYKEASAMFPVDLRRMEWSEEESGNLLKGLKQQFQAMLINGSCADSDHIDSIMSSIKDLEITPEKIRLFLPKVDWDRLAALYIPSRSGAECQSRYLNCDEPLINKNQWTAAEDRNLLWIVQQKGISNWFDIAVSLGTKRTPFQCLARYQRSLNASILKREWTKEEDEHLQAAVETYGESNWQLVASGMEGRTGTQCSNRWLRTLNPARERVGRWTAEEDKRLTVAMTLFGPKRWKKVADCVPGRTQAQCRERWVNSLDPSIRQGRWTQEEDSKLKAAIAEHGCVWTKVSGCVPGRTDNQCWRRWKVLFPNEVHPRQVARKIQKTALISNFSGRESERPALGPTDFVPSKDEEIGIPDNVDGITSDAIYDATDNGNQIDETAREESDPNEECRLASVDPVIQGVTVGEERPGLVQHNATRKKASKLQPRRKRVNSSDQVPPTTHEKGTVLRNHDAAIKKVSRLQPRKRAKPSDQVPATTHEAGVRVCVSKEGSGLGKQDASQNTISNLHPCSKRAKPSPQVPETRYEEEECVRIRHVPEYRYEEEMRIWYETSKMN